LTPLRPNLAQNLAQLTLPAVATTGSITTATNALTVASATNLTVGAQITVAGAGAAGGLLTTTITAIAGTAVTLAANASTTVTGAVVDAWPGFTLAGLGLNLDAGTRYVDVYCGNDALQYCPEGSVPTPSFGFPMNAGQTVRFSMAEANVAQFCVLNKVNVTLTVYQMI
jgi:hypothetical protein